MKAYQFDTPAEGLVQVDLESPRPGPGEVLLDVHAAGLCHSDIHILHGTDGNWLRKRPIVLGHEVAGVVHALGEGVVDVQIGDRVAVALISHPIDTADALKAPGLGCDGGYAQQMVVSADVLVAVPDAVSMAQAAVATDSIATAYHAVVTEAEIGPGMRVAIIGLGGLGLNGVRVAALREATVYGVDIDPTTFDAARAQGASDCFTSITDVPRPVDVIVDFAGMGTTTADAVARVKWGGRVVVVGLGSARAEISSHALVTRNIRLQGSLGASRDELEAVLALIADGSLTPGLEQVPFDSVPEALERLSQGKVSGRLYTEPNA
ncbi:zinc-binding dehydrogenase [Mycobacterium sp. pV006]|uniref:zinc-binding dehydrogenase n=1 Tax=Mycobacterium sp. pV006 TaxID=3238983 RepID=UPI00351B0BE8